MPRAIDGTRHKDRRKKILKDSKGFWGRRKNTYRVAKSAVAKAYLYAYRDRRTKKRDFRRLWISRLSAACRMNGITYSRFIHALHTCGIQLNRKALSNMAIEDKESFAALVEQVKSQANVT